MEDQKMKKLLAIQALLALILLVCVSGVLGQDNESIARYQVTTPNMTRADIRYDQFYTRIEGPIPSNPITAPQQIDIANIMPTTVYFSSQMQAVPFSQYKGNQTYTGGNSLWIMGKTAWSQYAVVPIGANVQILAISTSSGSGILKIVDSNGLTYSNNYFFYPSSLLSFYAATPGRYTITFVVGDVSSNPIIVDVPGTMTITYNPANNYNLPPNPSDFTGPQAALDYANAYKEYQKMSGNYWNYGLYPWLSPP